MRSLHLRSPLVLAALLALPASLSAQSHADSSHVLQQAIALDSATALLLPLDSALERNCGTKNQPGYLKAVCDVPAAVQRLLAKLGAGESALVTPRDTAVVVVPPPPVDTTTTPPPDTTVVVLPPPDTTTVPPGVNTPPALSLAHPFAPPSNGNVLPELPRDTVDAAYPAVTRVVRCTALQACLDTARTGDEIRLAPGASFANAVIKPTSRAGWLVVRTDVSDAALGGPWERMTSDKATRLNLATLTSTSNAPSLSFASGAHHVYVEGVRITTPWPSGTSRVVRIGFGESDPAQIPRYITLRHVVIDPGTADVRSCVLVDGAYVAVVSSSLLNCHSKLGDAQGVLGINAKGPLRIENNAIQASHQSFMTGGGDPSVVGQVPADIIIRRNHIEKPLSWKRTGAAGVYLATEWPGKTNIEFKLGKRILVEGNDVCHTWTDQQSGYAFNIKTVDQSGLAPWSETADVTVRYNHICGAAGFVQLAPLPQPPGVPLARVAIYDNIVDSLGVSPYGGPYESLLLQGIADVLYRNNWSRNQATSRAALYITGVNPRFVAEGNTYSGQYGVKYENGTASTLTPGALTGGNTMPAWGTSFDAWPALAPSAVRDALLQGVAP